MEYDFHGYYDGYTGSNAPLYHSSLDPIEADKDNNVVSIQYRFLKSFT